MRHESSLEKHNPRRFASVFFNRGRKTDKKVTCFLASLLACTVSTSCALMPAHHFTHRRNAQTLLVNAYDLVYLSKKGQHSIIRVENCNQALAIYRTSSLLFKLMLYFKRNLDDQLGRDSGDAVYFSKSATQLKRSGNFTRIQLIILESRQALSTCELLGIHFSRRRQARFRQRTA